MADQGTEEAADDTASGAGSRALEQADVSQSTKEDTRSSAANTTADSEYTKTDPWLAPIEHEEETVPGSFLIKFKPGHSMEQHFAYIGRELYDQPHRASGDHRGYAVSAILDEMLLLKIRRDPGVAHVYPAVPAYEDYEDEDEDVLM